MKCKYSIVMTAKHENSHRKILAVDDDPESLRLLEVALKHEGYQVATAESGEAGIAKILSWKPHLVLLDVTLPDLDGIQALSFVRKSDKYISTLFVSGKSKVDDVVRGLDAGADDYICKPFDVNELLSRIRCHLRIKDIRDELDQANARLQELVDTDDLTGLYNMRSLYQKLDHEIMRAQRYKRQVAVIMMDMDFFKSVNDENDHLFGSFVLSKVGEIIRNNIRSVDFAARYGGDEFLIVLTETTEQGALAFAERLRKVISDAEFKNDQHSKKLTSSLGVAVTPLDNSEFDARSLVRAADNALYKAKAKGRNTVALNEG